MAHQRQQSTAAAGGPHAVSLKVLRLSRPSLATQTPLPPTSFGNGLDISPKASLAYPSAGDNHSSFPLTPLLTLPSAFGAAYVGETFTCTLCANNEVQEGDSRSVSGVRITAELQTPGNHAGIALELASAEGAEDGTGEIVPGATMQRTLKHELKEEGPHVLAVTVTYTETLHSSEGGASGGRARSFRKLYQFVSQQLIAVRSKVTERKRREKDGSRQWTLEAQLENVGEASAVLEKVWLGEKDGISWKAVNGGESKEATVLKPQDVEQVMFVLGEKERSDDLAARVPLAQLNIDWRTAMGERGCLTTGWLASRGR
jgi:trafficking protein particle complex subunit 13